MLRMILLLFIIKASGTHFKMFMLNIHWIIYAKYSHLQFTFSYLAINDADKCRHKYNVSFKDNLFLI